MKKAFHLGVIALSTILITSCSKSSDDLLSNDQNASSAHAGRNLPFAFTPITEPATTITVGGTRILAEIKQPFEMVLGNPDQSILSANSGETAVFFVVIPEEYTREPLEYTALTCFDATDGSVINKYDLIASTEADRYGIRVPEALNHEPFMFGIVSLRDLSGSTRSITLRADINARIGTLTTQLDNAFTFQGE